MHLKNYCYPVRHIYQNNMFYSFCLPVLFVRLISGTAGPISPGFSSLLYSREASPHVVTRGYTNAGNHGVQQVHNNNVVADYKNSVATPIHTMVVVRYNQGRKKITQYNFAANKR